MLRGRAETAFFVLATVLLGLGGVAWLLTLGGSRSAVAGPLWAAGTVLGLLASLVTTTLAVVRRRPTVDVIAVLALGGALAVGEPFAGAMITVMLASGQLLEARAQARARRELRLLVERSPRTARRRAGDVLEVVPVEDVRTGDVLVVGTGEVVPVDGHLRSEALLDESALTGEPVPVQRPVGDVVRSGVVVAGPPAELLATAGAEESTYAGVVRLVEQAQATSAPFVRVADRFAVAFVPVTLALAGAAWAWSGDPVRAVAVLVVATPCPLLLAVPVAIVSGISRAARHGVVVKGGDVLERLAGARTVVVDKTGTVTRGRPEPTDVVVAPGEDADEVLRLAASLDQLSAHPVAASVVVAAGRRGLPLSLPTEVEEVLGQGVRGRVGEHEVRIGRAAWVAPDGAAWLDQVRRRADLDGTLVVTVAVDGRPVGALLLEDPIRPDAGRMLRALRAAGLDRVVLLTGDRADVAEAVGRVLGVDAVLAEHDPAAKLAVVEAEERRAPTLMVGDGINDAPALAAAGVGAALAARGASASSEAADVVLTVDRVDALAEAITIARRSRRVAREVVVVGMGLSGVAMVAAALGWIVPAVGAVLQEGIDVLAIGLALRAVLPPRGRRTPLEGHDLAVVERLRAEHDAVLPLVEEVRAVADRLTTTAPDLTEVRTLVGRLEHDLVPHERADEAELVPLATRALAGQEASAALSRAHAEIEQQVVRLRRLLGSTTADGAAEDVVELRRLLYGLYAVLRLHNAQEEEWAFGVVVTTA